MTTEEFFEQLSKVSEDFNYLSNCPYIYGVRDECLWCPITFLNFKLNRQLLNISQVGIAVDMLKLENADDIIKASDGTGSEELTERLKKVLNVSHTAIISNM